MSVLRRSDRIRIGRALPLDEEYETGEFETDDEEEEEDYETEEEDYETEEDREDYDEETRGMLRRLGKTVTLVVLLETMKRGGAALRNHRAMMERFWQRLCTENERSFARARVHAQNREKAASIKLEKKKNKRAVS